MSYIHFKLVSSTNYDKITFDGVSLSLGQLKKLIFEKAKFTKRFDYDLEIKNADTKEVYKNESDLIHKNTRVHVSRTIKNPSGPLRSFAKSVPSPPTTVTLVQPNLNVVTTAAPITTISQVTTSLTTTSTIVLTDNTNLDLKQNESINEQTKLISALGVKPVSTVIPEIRMESFKKSVSLPEITKPIVVEQKSIIKATQRTPPPHYVCTFCKKQGHFKHACPEVAAGIITKEDTRPKFPTGIPKSFMVKVNAGDPGAMLGPEGHVVPKLDFEALKVVKKDKTPFLTEEEEEELKKAQEETKLSEAIPSELTCPFVEHGKHLIKDAVLVPCCGHFICCDECIREKISKDEVVECPIKGCGHEVDSLESITPHHQMRKMVNDYLNDIKLNKINKIEKTSKIDEAFIDVLLNDEFSVITTSTTTVATSEKSPIVSLADKNVDSIKLSPVSSPESVESEKNIEIYTDIIESSFKNTVPLSPVQDSKISSTLVGTSTSTQDTNTINIVTTASIKTESFETQKILGKSSLSEADIPRNVTLENKMQQNIYPSSNQHLIPVLHTTTAGPYQFPHHLQPKYPYHTKLYRSPMHMHQANYLNYPQISTTGPTSVNQTTTVSQTYPSIISSQQVQSGYYPFKSSIYSHRQVPQTYTTTSNIYTPYGTVPTSYVQQSVQPNAQPLNPPILSEKEFYECQKRLRKEHEFSSDTFTSKKRRRTNSRSQTHSRSRSRSTSSRSRHTTDSYHSHKESKRHKYDKEYENRKHKRDRSHSKSQSLKNKSTSPTESPLLLSPASTLSSVKNESIKIKKSSDKEKIKTNDEYKSKKSSKDEHTKKDKHKKSKKKHKHKEKSSSRSRN